MRQAGHTALVRSLIVLALAVGIATDVVSPDEHADLASGRPRILVVDVEGTVTAGKAQFLRESIADAVEQELDAIIVRLDTPGGLVDSTLEIIRDLLNVTIPVVTYVYPRGGIAASAGTFILMAGHVAAMSPGTTVGAAMPVQMQPGGGETRTADDKTVEFLAGHMTNIAEVRGRPAETARRFVTENLTLGADAALEEGMIEVIADDMAYLISQLHGRVVEISGEEVHLATRDAELIELEMTTRQLVMDFISDPQVAFLLLMLGMYGIFFGLNMPGTFVPETLGAIALVLALFGLGMFSVDALGVVLIVVAIVLFVAEAFTPTFGFLTTAGVIFLVLGALLMPVEPMMPEEWFQTFIATVLGMAVVTVAFFILVITKVIQSRNKPAVHEDLGMKGYEGSVMDALDPTGSVKIRGEWWNARSASGEPVPVGTVVRVARQRGMELVVEPVGDSSSTTGRQETEQ